MGVKEWQERGVDGGKIEFRWGVHAGNKEKGQVHHIINTVDQPNCSFCVS